MLRATGVRLINVNAPPHDLLGVSVTSSKSQIKKAYYTLAMKYHPDNPETGCSTTMNAINVAYGKINSDDFFQVKMEAEDIATAGMSRSERNQRHEESYQRGTPDEEKQKWQEREEARREARERFLRLKRKKKFGKKRVDPIWAQLGGPHVERAVKTENGKYLYHIMDQFYEADHYIPPTMLNYRLIRSNYDTNEFIKMGLRLQENMTREDKVLRRREEREHAGRTIPFIEGVDYGAGGTSTTANGIVRKTWRDTHRVEIILIAVILFYWISDVVPRLYTRWVRTGTVSNGTVDDDKAYSISQARNKRLNDENIEVDALVKILEDKQNSVA